MKVIQKINYCLDIVIKAISGLFAYLLKSVVSLFLMPAKISWLMTFAEAARADILLLNERHEKDLNNLIEKHNNLIDAVKKNDQINFANMENMAKFINELSAKVGMLEANLSKLEKENKELQTQLDSNHQPN